MGLVQLVMVLLTKATLLSNGIGREPVKGFEQLGCGRMGSIAILRIELQRWRPSVVELLAQFPFQQRLDEQSDKEDEHVGLNTLNLLEEQRGGAMYTLKLTKAFL